MKIVENYKVPTGNILVVDGQHGQLECLSIGDYGKDVNLKADFLGLDRQVNKVEHQKMLPLEDKWVITISTQYGCSMNCCLPKTKIKVLDGYKNIEDIKIGHKVCGFNINTNKYVEENVTRLYVNDYDGNIIEIEINNSIKLSLTPNHPVYTNRGWVCADRLIEDGDIIRISMGVMVKIKKITIKYYKGKVYNFECVNTHTYFANDILVHNCNFCDVPKVGPGINATVNDLYKQVECCLSLHPNVETTKRLNLHYARMGEPTWNPNVIEATYTINELMQSIGFPFHPVVSTMMPKHNKNLLMFLLSWMHIKNEVLDGNAGLQLSINSTSYEERKTMFNNNTMCLGDMEYNILRHLPKPKGRKITLNFAVADYKIDPSVLLSYFSPDDYVIKLTPMHKTTSAITNNIKTDGDYTEYYPYEHYEQKLVKAGYDVIVFIASKEEDEGRITCGNALLSGTRPFDIGLI